MGILVSACLLAGIICATIASGRRRSVLAWFVIGSLLPVLGFILILVLPSPGFDMTAGFDLAPEPGPYEDLTETSVARRTHLQSATLDGIVRLVELRDRGALTPYEFEEKKAELLARI